MKTGTTIQKKLVFMIVSIVSIVTLIGYLIFTSWYVKEQKKQHLQMAHMVSKVISQDLAKLLLLNSVSSASDLSTKLDSFDFLNWLVVYKLDKTPVYKYAQNHKDFKYQSFDSHKMLIKDNEMVCTLKTSYMGQELGYMTLSMKYVSAYELVKRNILWMLLVYLGLIVFSYILSIYYAKKFTKPIIRLVEFVKNIDMKNISKDRVSLQEDNEFLILEKKINKMLDKLDSSLQQQRIASVAFETHSGMIITNEKFEVLQINQAYTKITGYKIDDIRGKQPPVFSANKKVLDNIKQILKTSHYWAGEITNYTKHGDKFLEYLTIQEVCDDDCNITNYVFSFVDISKQKEAEKTIAHLSKYDLVTGLANKQLILENLDKLKNNTFTLDNWHILVEFDIKNFKYINEAYGYATGDKLLQSIADRLHELGLHNILGKIGVDEFIVGFESGFPDEESATMYAQLIAERIISLITKPYLIDEHHIELKIHVGIYVYDITSQNSEDILKNSNLALHNAKQNDKQIAFFNEEIENQVQSYMHIYSDLKKAIQNSEFEMYYQPQYSINEKLVSAEALIRWHHPKLGFMPPDEFISIAEKSGMIEELGWWIIDDVFKTIAEWKNIDKLSNLSVAINISAKQFAQDGFVEGISKYLKKYKINPEKVKLELVESLLLKNVDNTIAKMKRLQSFGIKLSLDDFGTGYSSLEYLKLLPLEQIKIDKSFVMSMRENEKDLSIVKSVISLGDAFGFDVVAEGVETKDDFMLLKALSCEYYQGYYFSKPLPKNDFEMLIV
jgi:diguanylate cyclase (GGDEF)-like protein/PAS domain S-box-containing protein